MLRGLKAFWDRFREAGEVIGGFVSGVFLVVFYFVVFGFFAVPYRIFANPYKAKPGNSNWIPKTRQLTSLEDFRTEG